MFPHSASAEVQVMHTKILATTVCTTANGKLPMPGADCAHNLPVSHSRAKSSGRLLHRGLEHREGLRQRHLRGRKNVLQRGDKVVLKTPADLTELFRPATGASSNTVFVEGRRWH